MRLSTAQDNREPEFPGEDTTSVPIRFRTMVWAVAALVVLGAGTVFGTAYTVNKLQTMLAQEAREETHAAAEALCRQIGELVKAEGPASLAQITSDPRFLGKIQSLCGDRKIATAAVLDRERRVLYYSACGKTITSIFGPETIRSAPIEPTDPPDFPYQWVQAHLPPSVVPARVPIADATEILGYVEVGLRSQASLARIDELSTEITASLIAMVLIVFAILMLTIVLIYFSFRRQMELIQRTVEAEHLVSMGALASGLAHEIRSPLHAMNLHLDVVEEDIQSGIEDREETIRCIERIKTQTTQLNRIVTNFLSATIPSQINPVPIELRTTLQEIGQLLSPDMRNRQIALDIDVPEMRVLGDQGALQQVILNLLVNARTILSKCESNGDRRIRITAEDGGVVWRVYVDDSGPGIPKGKEACIFKSFFTKGCGGTGFGLSIARRIMDAHRGRITAQRGPLGGTRFTIEIPKA